MLTVKPILVDSLAVNYIRIAFDSALTSSILSYKYSSLPARPVSTGNVRTIAFIDLRGRLISLIKVNDLSHTTVFIRVACSKERLRPVLYACRTSEVLSGIWIVSYSSSKFSGVYVPTEDLLCATKMLAADSSLGIYWKLLFMITVHTNSGYPGSSPVLSSG